MVDRADLDHQLARATLAGDQGAFVTLVARYQRLVAAVAWRHGVRDDDIEDLVSEVFLKVFRNLHRYRPEHPFSTWLYRLTLNHVVDRSRRLRRETARVEMPPQVVDERPGARQRMLAEERASLLRTALFAIDPRYREALALVYVEGLKVDEVARILAIPEGTVKTRLMRGREAIRRFLARHHPGYFGS